MNIAEVLLQAARSSPAMVALVEGDRSLTYGELDDLTGRIAAGLVHRGLQPGDRVALFLPSSIEFALCYLAAQKAGLVAVSITAMAKAEELAYMVQDAGARLLFTLPELHGVAAAAASRLAAPPLVCCCGAGAEPDALAELAQASRPLAPLFRERDETAAILYTSGTTGYPKGAALSQAAVITNIVLGHQAAGITAADRVLCFLPLFHCFGQNFILGQTLLAGGTLFLQRRFDPQAVWETVLAKQVSVLFGVPTAYHELLRQAPGRHGLRYCFNGADTAPESLSRAWTEATGLTLFEGYGLTEAGPFVSYNHPFRHRCGSLGAAVPTVEMRVVDADGQPLPIGEPGEIEVRSPSLMQGYWGAPEETALVLCRGWLRTGDVGVQEDDGHFFLVDRVKDMVNVAGFKVYPREVERVLAAHPEVAEAAIVGVPHAVRGEVARAYVVARPGCRPDGQVLGAWLKERVAAYKVPAQWELVDSIPKGPTGKVLKKLLRQRSEPVEGGSG